ncbi:MAG: bifunctional UDP-N-acetylglucosamine diphosphorylase/glucosamine-1-phosphate N-acetyltransferase GlmU [Armatimonadetes bacterium]|nr:bifunctional UDP-N-acetylglucosamine diphosphorylase/glucosamine-1-phosphate N-acetyltransferase GlmU [Armatimonadota bacterium]
MGESVAAIVLAAGQGTRMKSALPKCLHEVCGMPIVGHILLALRGAEVVRPVVVVGKGGEEMIEALSDRGFALEFVWQREQLGTGHAALMAKEILSDHQGPVVIMAGDTPLVSAEALIELIKTHRESGAHCTVATVKMPDPEKYGRIIRSASGEFDAIIEYRDADAHQRNINEVNTGIYVVDGPTLFRILPTLKAENDQKEYYLTDIVSVLRKEGKPVATHVFTDADTFLGVNDRWQLAQAEKIMRLRIAKLHALNGVTIRDPDTTYIGVEVQIGQDATIEPGTTISGQTTIGSGSRVGPYTIVDRSTLGSRVTAFMSRISEAEIGDDVKIGPFANIRPLSKIGNGSKIGNFVEVKKSKLGPKVAVSHLSYIGDASIGADSNIGAGTITCNYDGFQKHLTTIGAGAFVGSNSTLVAPITIGDGAFVAAGSVITEDIPADALGIARGRQEVKEGWAQRWRNKNKVNQ